MCKLFFIYFRQLHKLLVKCFRSNFTPETQSMIICCLDERIRMISDKEINTLGKKKVADKFWNYLYGQEQ